MNRNVVLRFVILALMLLNIIGPVRVSLSTSNSYLKSDMSNLQEISEKEEAELYRKLGQSMTWIVYWASDNMKCLSGENISLQRQLDKHKDEQLLAVIEATKSEVSVTIDSIHHRFVFGRTKNKSIYLKGRKNYCETTYDESVRLYESSSRLAKQVMQDILNRKAKLEGKEPVDLNQKEDIVYSEYKWINVQSLMANKEINKSDWNAEKRSLYAKMLTAIAVDSRISCQPNLEIELLVPDFNPIDPGTYVFIKEPPESDDFIRETIVKITFGINNSTMDYEVADIRLILLKEEVDYFLPIIKRTRPVTVKLLCGQPFNK